MAKNSNFLAIKVDTTYDVVQLSNDVVDIIECEESQRIHKHIETSWLAGTQNSIQEADVYRNEYL